ncbi:glutaminyl-peptide cyclotransferase [Pontimicrobium sp. IMCC45349]|uniref:glutaminyl-peptide cyclotransferase n=1 Tax=Pontimicrobium sp. IMCC45349 TaxID=3391574 RepID=UPI0039A324F3
MQFHKLLIVTFLSLILSACGSKTEKKKNNFSIQINNNEKLISNNSTLNISLKSKDNALKTDDVTYTLNGNPVTNGINLSNTRLGNHTLKATISYGGETEVISKSFTLVNQHQPKIYTYKILNEYPHDITSYTQGLEFFNGDLYESTGQYGESKLRKVNYKTAEVLQNINLESSFFGEGLTILNNNVYQLTWQENTGFVYDLETFEKKSTFKYGKSIEGWGLCNDGTQLYKSDGTEKIWILNPNTLAEESYIEAYTNKGKLNYLNELEWIDGKIYANRYYKDGVAIINPKNGAIEGVIDFRNLRNKVTQHPGLDVLNGIAYNPETKTLFVTGKRWDKLFEVEIIEK